MTALFDGNIIFDNIYYLAKRNGKKIGELESEVGVSAGYISRTGKDSKANPGIDFVIKIADSLGVSIDTILKVKLSEMSPTEQYVANFINQLNKDTIAADLNWRVEVPDDLNRIEPDKKDYVENPLFDVETFYEEGETEYPDQVTRVVFTSRSFGVHTYIKGNCYELSMKNDAILYLMNIEKTVHRTDDPTASAIEMWMTVPTAGKQFLCSNIDNSQLAPLINILYKNISEYMRHPKIDPSFKNLIDAYLENGDLTNDSNYEELKNMPF